MRLESHDLPKWQMDAQLIQPGHFSGVDDLVNFYRSSAVHLPTTLKIACKGAAPPAECQAVGYSNILHQCIIESMYLVNLEKKLKGTLISIFTAFSIVEAQFWFLYCR